MDNSLRYGQTPPYFYTLLKNDKLDILEAIMPHIATAFHEDWFSDIYMGDYDDHPYDLRNCKFIPTLQRIFANYERWGLPPIKSDSDPSLFLLSEEAVVSPCFIIESERFKISRELIECLVHFIKSHKITPVPSPEEEAEYSYDHTLPLHDEAIPQKEYLILTGLLDTEEEMQNYDRCVAESERELEEEPEYTDDATPMVIVKSAKALRLVPCSPSPETKEMLDDIVSFLRSRPLIEEEIDLGDGLGKIVYSDMAEHQYTYVNGETKRELHYVVGSFMMDKHIPLEIRTKYFSELEEIIQAERQSVSEIGDDSPTYRMFYKALYFYRRAFRSLIKQVRGVGEAGEPLYDFLVQKIKSEVPSWLVEV
jgi:hypothetical protein